MTQEQIQKYLSGLSDEQLIREASRAQTDLKLARATEPGSEWQRTCETACFEFQNEVVRREMARERSEA